MSGDKMVVGELERVWIDPPGAFLIARIDTGAHSSSVHAENLVELERDGDDWVRFDLILNDEITTLERQVERYVRVYQQADRQGTRRPVVSIRLKLGDVQDTFEFTLADRSHLEYQMILGRNFLADMALIDVGKQFHSARLSATSRLVRSDATRAFFVPRGPTPACRHGYCHLSATGVPHSLATGGPTNGLGSGGASGVSRARRADPGPT